MFGLSAAVPRSVAHVDFVVEALVLGRAPGSVVLGPGNVMQVLKTRSVGLIVQFHNV